MLAQRAIRHEQDAAYHASLAADQQKEVERMREEREREEREREREREERQRQARREAERAMKIARLPPEPPLPSDAMARGGEGGEGGGGDAVSVMVRLPDGSRKSRRFLRSQSVVCHLYDFIDLNR